MSKNMPGKVIKSLVGHFFIAFENYFAKTP